MRLQRVFRLPAPPPDGEQRDSRPRPRPRPAPAGTVDHAGRRRAGINLVENKSAPLMSRSNGSLAEKRLFVGEMDEKKPATQKKL